MPKKRKLDPNSRGKTKGSRSQKKRSTISKSKGKSKKLKSVRNSKRCAKKPTLRKKLTVKNAMNIYNFLQAVKKMSESDFKTITPYLNDDGCRILSDCMYNSIFSDGVADDMKNNLRKALSSKKEIIRKLARYNKSFKYHRKNLPQFGGNIGLIVSSVLPLIISFLKSKNIL